MERERIYFYFFLASVLFFIFASLLMLLPFAVPILWAVVIGTVLYPVYRYIERLLKSRTLSAFIMTLIVFLFLIIPLSIISILVFQQMIDATQKIVLYLQSHSYKEILQALGQYKLIKEYMDKLSPAIGFLEREEFRKLMAESLNRIFKFLGDKVGQFAFVIGRNVFYIFVFLITFFFILRDGPGILQRIQRLIPMDKTDLEDIIGTVYKTVLAVVYGSVGTALIQAMLGLIAYSIVGIKFALLWSTLTFFAAFIPPFGASAVWFPLAVYSFFNIGTWQAVFLGLWGLLLISSMDNFVRPLIIKQGVQIPYVVLFFATIGGLLKFGLIGVFLGPIIFTTLFALFKIYERRILNQDT
ncbi:putative PurR-regulated permease PerM [Hydrogenivirga caldilitoris]|uniref:Putative PurR-regulated permease PerM n=2 Tax=Hydrogenivirga caldilitoris TaxID=246264 RepID=A0A497XQH0_9AQUI|nr:putative PurR-regulated permease PerM [Hydrogenivirga caldilitoris]